MRGRVLPAAAVVLLNACFVSAGTPDAASLPPDAAGPGVDAATPPPPPPPPPPTADAGIKTYELAIPVSPEVRAAGGEVSVIRLPNEGALVQERLNVAPGTEVLTITATNVECLAVTQSAPAAASPSVAVAQPGCGDPAYSTGVELRVPEDFASIQAAIDAAGPGDTVRVGPGVWREGLKLRPGVRLRGSGASQTVLDGQSLRGSLIDVTAAPGVVISGFTLRRLGTADIDCPAYTDPLACSGDWYAAAIYGDGHWVFYQDYAAAHPELNPVADAPSCSGAFAFIYNNVFEQNYIAVMPYFHTRLILANNVFRDNKFAYAANHLQDRGALLNNVFWDSSEMAIGITAGYVDVVNNVIARSGTAFRQEYIQQGQIACNVFWQNATHQVSQYPEEPPRFVFGELGNVEADPLFVDPAGGDFHLAPGSPAIDKGCSALGNSDAHGSWVDIGAYGGPLGGW